MSDNCTVKDGSRLTEPARMAIVAAVAAGRTQTQVARDFNIHRNTVSALCKTVREGVRHPANPLSPDYRENLKVKAVMAVEAGLDARHDPYKRANIGVRVLEGIGEFQHAETRDENVQIVVSWAGDALSLAGAETINVTPEKPKPLME